MEVVIQGVKIRKGAFTSFKDFKKTFDGVLKGDLKKHYFTYSGKKVK